MFTWYFFWKIHQATAVLYPDIFNLPTAISLYVSFGRPLVHSNANQKADSHYILNEKTETDTLIIFFGRLLM